MDATALAAFLQNSELAKNCAALLEKVVAGYTTQLGANHKSTLTAMMNLAVLLDERLFPRAACNLGRGRRRFRLRFRRRAV